MSLNAHLWPHLDRFPSWALWVTIRFSVKGTEHPASSPSLWPPKVFFTVNRNRAQLIAAPMRLWVVCGLKQPQGLQLQDTQLVWEGLWTTICTPPLCNHPLYLPPFAISFSVPLWVLNVRFQQPGIHCSITSVQHSGAASLQGECGPEMWGIEN